VPICSSTLQKHSTADQTAAFLGSTLGTYKLTAAELPGDIDVPLGGRVALVPHPGGNQLRRNNAGGLRSASPTGMQALQESLSADGTDSVSWNHGRSLLITLVVSMACGNTARCCPLARRSHKGTFLGAFRAFG
jgi:hypothetical protein